VRPELWQPISPERLKDRGGQHAPHPSPPLPHRYVTPDPARQLADDLLGVRRSSRLDADEHAGASLLHIRSFR
jgi:hypothetical protein